MRRPVQEDLHQINDKIRAKEVRLVGENVEPGVYPLAKALEIARDQELDLVVISDKAEPYISVSWIIKNSCTSKRKSRRN
jgi:translation initiation factor IF-3